jgi:hypothetical protein
VTPKEGNWITFRTQCTEDGKTVIKRKFYEIKKIEDDKYLCSELYRPKKPDMWYDTVIDNLFGCEDDEVFETFKDCKKAYPEEFL